MYWYGGVISLVQNHENTLVDGMSAFLREKSDYSNFPSVELFEYTVT